MLHRAGAFGGGEGPSDGSDWTWVAVPVGFVAGSIPFSNLMARRVRGVDLRRVGTHTVSGTGLFAVAGFGPLALAGILEVAKGAVGPMVAKQLAARFDGAPRPDVEAAAAGAAVVGHNWSPFLGGAGGRGLSPAIGALLATAPAGSGILLAGLTLGKAAGEAALGCFGAYAALVPAVRRVHGRDAAWAAVAVVVPIVLKRLAGNERPTARGVRPYVWRLLFDRDSRHPSQAGGDPVAAIPTRRTLVGAGR
jgi:glycerol-3-phosphate acyltransferase PlsY